MAADWLAALIARLAAGDDAVLVTVARTEGSAPREAGASMVVGPETTADTIGGGHLEWQALHHARRLLQADDRRPQVVRYSLGARLGQCCGGVVWLLFETIPAATLPQWQARQAALAAGHGLQRRLDSTAAASDWSPPPGGAGIALTGDAAHWRFVQDLTADAFPVYLFGAGHVARALVAQLRPLGARIAWIDSRDEAFTGLDTAGLRAVVTDTPEAEVAAAPAGSYFLVMTHSHALDFALCERIFKRRDYAYFGLIGSRSKRASFEHRLLDRGLRPDRLAELTCPIGIAGIVSKEPAAIALAVAAQLLQVRGSRQLVARAGRPAGLAVHAGPESR